MGQVGCQRFEHAPPPSTCHIRLDVENVPMFDMNFVEKTRRNNLKLINEIDYEYKVAFGTSQVGRQR